MKDRDGTEIVVGCCVMEADFSYGEGTVKSITVPCDGGGFNVGVAWKDPTKGGPAYSAEGGGRGSQHLRVVEPAADVLESEQPVRELENSELKALRFKVRFGRSPTPSQAELDEGTWSELEEKIEDEEDGAAVGSKGGASGGEGAGKEEAPAGSFRAVVTAGARIKICMGMPGKWYGALVGIEHNEHTELGFDDGDVQLIPTSELKQNFDEKLMLPAVPSEGGLVANKSGYPGRAVAFLKYSNGMQTKTIGLFIGDADPPKIAGHVVYSEVHVREDAFVQTRATRGAQSMQDRYGLHSFTRGDLVEYTHAKQGEVPPTCVVYGCIEAPAVSDDNQIRRILVLYDIQLDLFFLSTWPAWRRVPKVGLDVDFVCDNNDHVQMAEREVALKMQAAFPNSLASGSLMGIGTHYKVSQSGQSVSQ